MDQLICSIRYNQGRSLIGTSGLTFRLWEGSVFYIECDEKLSDFELTNATQAELPVLHISSGISDLCWSSHNKFLVGTDEGEFKLIQFEEDTHNFVILMSCNEHDNLISELDTIYNTSLAISGSYDTCIKIWDIETQMSTRTYKAHSDCVTSVSLNSSDFNCFISCSQDSNVLIWDQRKQKPALRLNFHSMGYASCSSWSNVTPHILSIGSEYGFLCLFDSRMTDKALIQFKLHDRFIRKTRINDKLIATCSEDCSTSVVVAYDDLTSFKKVYTNKNHQDYVTDLSWFENSGTDYITCSWDGHIMKHNIERPN